MDRRFDYTYPDRRENDEPELRMEYSNPAPRPLTREIYFQYDDDDILRGEDFEPEECGSYYRGKQIESIGDLMDDYGLSWRDFL